MATAEQKAAARKELARRELARRQALKSQPEPTTSAPTTVTPAQATLKGAEQGVTFGFGDEIGAGLEAGMSALASKGLLPGVETDPYAGQSMGEVYSQTLPKERAAIEKASSDQPGAYLGGNVAGTLLTAPLGGATVKGAATVGGIEALGRSDKTDIVDTAKDVGLGALGGAAFSKLADQASVVKDYLMKKSTDLSRSSLGYTKGMLKGKEAHSARIANEALERGIVTPRKDAAEMLSEVQSLKHTAGEQIGEVAKEVNSLGIKADTTGMVDKMFTDLGEKYGNAQLDPGLYAKFNRAMVAIEDQADSPEGIRAIKNAINDKGNWKNPNPTEAESMYRDVWRELDRQYTDAVSMAAQQTRDPKLVNMLSEAKDNYRFAAEAEKPLTDKLAKESAYQGIGLIGYGAAGMATGGDLSPEGIAKGVATGFAMKYARNKAAPTAAVATRGLAKMMNKAGKYGDILKSAMARGGEKSAVATYNTLMQNDPEFRQKAMDSDE